MARDRRDGMDESGDDDCSGPHRQCHACGGQHVEFRETLYVPATGRAHGVASAHHCWHCKGRGFYCRATVRCTPAHE